MIDRADSTVAAGLTGGWDTHIHVFAGPGLPDSHYTPSISTIDMWQQAAAPIGVDHAVIVQPSVYGTDNTILLNALKLTNGRHRGVVVISESISENELIAMHTSGVRGARINLHSPIGNAGMNIDGIAARIAALRWHLQFYASPADFPMIIDVQHKWGCDIVLDHFAGMHRDRALTATELENLSVLAGNGAWIKCSALYRLGVTPSFTAGKEMISDALTRFKGRVLWGSDWPHTWFLETQNESNKIAPTMAELLSPFADTFSNPDTRRNVMIDAPQELYR